MSFELNKRQIADLKRLGKMAKSEAQARKMWDRYCYLRRNKSHTASIRIMEKTVRESGKKAERFGRAVGRGVGIILGTRKRIR